VDPTTSYAAIYEYLGAVLLYSMVELLSVGTLTVYWKLTVVVMLG
jgi:hypothetical protein